MDIPRGIHGYPSWDPSCRDLFVHGDSDNSRIGMDSRTTKNRLKTGCCQIGCAQFEARSAGEASIPVVGQVLQKKVLLLLLKA